MERRLTMFRTIQAFFLGVVATLAVQLCIYMTTQTVSAEIIPTTLPTFEIVGQTPTQTYNLITAEQKAHIEQQITLICLALIPLLVPNRLIKRIQNYGKKQI